MKPAALILLAFGLTACTPRDQEKVRVEARKDLHQAESDAKKAGREIDKGLHTSREKIRKAIGDTDNPDRR